MSWLIFLLLAFGSLNAWLGYLIRNRREYSLMAGVDIRRVGDPERLARSVGAWTIGIGLSCLAGAGALLAWPARSRPILNVTAIAICACAVSIFMLGRRSRRY